jgi:O-antigen ligase
MSEPLLAPASQISSDIAAKIETSADEKTSSVAPRASAHSRRALKLFAVGWSLALIAPYIPLPQPAYASLAWHQELIVSLLAVLACVMLFKRRSDANIFQTNRIELSMAIPAALFAVWSGVSSTWAAQPYKASYQALTWGLYLVFFLLTRRAFLHHSVARAAIKMLGAVLCFLSLWCMFDFWTTPVSAAGVPAKTRFLFFSGFGEMMATALPFFAALALRLKRKRAAFFCGATATLAWLAALASSQRAPVIGAICGLLFLAACALFKSRSRARQVLKRGGLLIAAFTLATLMLYVPSPFGSHNQSSVDRLKTTTANDENLRVRYLFWMIGLEMWRGARLLGVGANNYEDNYPQARADFSAAHPNDPIIEMHDGMLVRWAHSQYVQILVELGIIGLALFALFALAVIYAFWRAWRGAKNHLLVAGAGGGLLAFFVSALTSVNAFVWMGGGLIFFFLAAFLCHAAARTQFIRTNAPRENSSSAANSKRTARLEVFILAPRIALYVLSAVLLISLVMTANAGRRAVNSVLVGIGGTHPDVQVADQLFRQALAFDPGDATTHFEYGIVLYTNYYWSAAISHLQYSIAHGFNETSCYAYLASAQEAAGDFTGSEKTLADAVRVYPRSVFLRVRHAKALRECGSANQAEAEERRAAQIDARGAAGWRKFIYEGAKAAEDAARADASVAPPSELRPTSCVWAMTLEHDALAFKQRQKNQ